MKITIILPDDLFSAANAVASRLGMSRSELYAAAIAELIARHDADVTARLNQVYAADSGTLDPVFHRAQGRSISLAEG